MNHLLSSLLSRSIYWNSFESISFQLVLCIHQATLFYTLPAEQYGIVGVLFSGIYAIGTISNVGFDTALGSWWSTALASKKGLLYLIILQLIPQVLIAITLASGVAIFYPFSNNVEKYLLIVCGILTLLESIKKSLKVCMYLAFANHIVAPTEVVLVLLYTSTVWSLYIMYGALDLVTIFAPMVLTTALSILVYIYHLAGLYRTAPQENSYVPPLRHIALIRLGNYTTQLTHLIFSGNILIPLFAHKFGLTVAGSLKFIDNIAYSLGTIMRKVVGTTGQALFAHTKSMEHRIQAELFASITNKAYQIIYALAIFFLVNGTKVNHATIITLGIGTALLYGLLIITENIFYVYEQFFITHDKPYYSALFNSSSFCITYALLHISQLSLTNLLIVLLLIRTTILLLLEIVVRSFWGARSNMRVQPWYGLSALTAALVFFFIWR